MPAATARLPDHFSIAGYERVAGIPSFDPEVFAQLNRHGPIAGPVFYKKFGDGERSCCLIQRNSPVLMVAHVDTVMRPAARAVVDGERLLHNGLDNRLGVYLGLDVLPAMGLPVDLILTTGEERGASTALLLTTRKQYRWTFSFDRKGDDVVCYQYECSPLTGILAAAGFRLGVGSYSCIAELEHLGCCGMNFGCGMSEYHSEDAYCELPVLAEQLQRFAQFYHTYADQVFPHRLPDGFRDRRTLHWFAVPIESLLWQLEYHRKRGADEAAFRCQVDLARHLSASPDLRQEFALELASFPELAKDPAERP